MAELVDAQDSKA